MSGHFQINTVGGVTFSKHNSLNQPFFKVCPSVSGEEALEHASVLMSCVNKLTQLAGESDDNNALVWAAHYLGEQAKALVDDVTTGIQIAEGGQA
ncbi:DUF3077 domain-containing protein [Pseudomonas sp. SWRI59]|uniref:DUF3077 domain-containing protein n=1 Tax=unclassified Pseudomonas TaxID=196821 RepID=UPI001648EB6C|nr:MULTISPECIES: DUF3077 domain-containing protein [unclassified Pseudomonas]MBC3504431.1 DUF3077 domain-containing protein [Pseudomonas sp. SWRI59]MBC3509745.1 DUF3077 domain-containing protein [Pseudomonas sp. SWRI68]